MTFVHARIPPDGANAGVQTVELGSVGTFTAAELLAACKPRNRLLYPPAEPAIFV